MKERYEFRVVEAVAARLLPPDTGKRLGHIRQVFVTPTDSLFEVIRSEDIASRARGNGSIFSGWDIRRMHTPTELGAAELLHAIPTGTFEPEGELCGTLYDERGSCGHCGAGRRQASVLSLDARRHQPGHDIETQTLPKKLDFARTIADEYVASKRLHDILTHFTGAVFSDVMQCRTVRPIRGWFQLTADGPPIDVRIPPTSYGIKPFDPDETGEYRCPLGHVAGLNLLSELTVDRSTWSGKDWVETRQLSGRRAGVLVPHAEFLISQRLYQVLKANAIRGLRFEVAHLA